MTTSPGKNEAKTDFLKRCTDVEVAGGNSRREGFAACNAVWDGARKRKMALSVPVAITKAQGEELAAGGGGQRGFLITAKTGNPVQREYYTLAIDMAGIRTDPKMPVLRQHEPLRIVGHGQAYKDGNNLYIEGEFSKATKDAAEVLRLADEGYPWQASVGIYPDEYKTLGPGKIETVNGFEVKGPAIIFKRSHVREVSFVALGADPDTAGIAFSVESPPVSGPIEKRCNEAPWLVQVRRLMSEGLEWFEAMGEVEKLYPEEFNNKQAAMSPPEREEHLMQADKEISKKARELAAVQGLDIKTAIRRVVAQNPDLIRRYNQEALAESHT